MRTKIYSVIGKFNTHKYQNAQIILIGAREGKDVIKQETGLDIETEERKEYLSSSHIFTKIKIRKEQVPTKPIIEGKF